MSVGDRIKDLREQMGVSQNKLAKLAGISQGLVTSCDSFSLIICNSLS